MMARFRFPVWLGLLGCVLAVLAVRCDRQPDTTGRAAQDSQEAPAGAATQPVDGRVADWPCFRGAADNRGVARVSLAAPLAVRWRFEVRDSEPVTATAAIVDAVAYVGTGLGDFHALDIETGAAKWTFQTQEEAGIGSSAAVDDAGRIYFGDALGRLYCLTAAGVAAWHYDAGGEVISSPQIHGALVIFGSYDGAVHALERSSGALRWKAQTDAQVHSTVGIVDGRVLAAGCDGALHVIDAETGAESSAARTGARTAAAVAVQADRAYLGTLGSEVLCIDWAAGEIVWRFRDAEREFPFHSSAAFYQDLILLGGRDKRIRALDMRTGDQRWFFQARARVDSSPVVSGDLVYVGSSDGRLMALDAGTGEARWEFEAGGAITASPAIGGGVLVIGTEDGVIYCLAPARKSP